MRRIFAHACGLCDTMQTHRRGAQDPVAMRRAACRKLPAARRLRKNAPASFTKINQLLRRCQQRALLAPHLGVVVEIAIVYGLPAGLA